MHKPEHKYCALDLAPKGIALIAAMLLLATLFLPRFVLAQELACYMPTQSNVNYSQVLALSTDKPNQLLRYGPAPLQYGELWLPNIKSKSDSDILNKSPLVVFIHGGCWLNEYDLEHTHALSTALSNSGYAVWAPEYRRTGDKGGGWPGSYEDIQQSIEFIIGHDTPQVDNSRIVVIGHSAGGHLALLAGAEFQQSLVAVIGLAAIVDIAKYAEGDNNCELATHSFMRGTPSEKPEAYAAANPINQTLHPNTVLLHGSEDSIVALGQAQTMPDNLIVVDGAGHFDMLHSGTPTFQQLLKQLAKALP